MEASVAIQSLPGVADDEELCRIVDEVIAYIAGTGYNYFVGPFETTIEGPYDELMDIVKECQHIAIRAGAPSVAAYVKISYKPEGEVLSIEKKIGKYQGYTASGRGVLPDSTDLVGAVGKRNDPGIYAAVARGRGRRLYP